MAATGFQAFGRMDRRQASGLIASVVPVSSCLELVCVQEVSWWECQRFGSYDHARKRVSRNGSKVYVDSSCWSLGGCSVCSVVLTVLLRLSSGL